MTGGGGGVGTATTTGGASGVPCGAGGAVAADPSRRAGQTSVGNEPAPEALRVSCAGGTEGAVGAGVLTAGAGAVGAVAAVVVSAAGGVAGCDASRRSGTGGTFSATTDCSRGK